MKKKNRSSRRYAAVRWLGAFGKGQSVDMIASFESDPQRPVSAQCINRKSDLYSIYSRVGLLVDQSRTNLVVGYSKDVWSVYDCKNGGFRPTRNNNPRLCKDIKKAKSWDELFQITAPYGHNEIMISEPVYKAVVVQRNTSKNGISFAKAIAKRMGLPVVLNWSPFRRGCKYGK